MHQRWPKCGQCTLIRGVFIPVEEYGIDPQNPDGEKPIGPMYRARFKVFARCSHTRHGGDHTADERLNLRGRPHEQWATIDVPIWWGDAHVLDAIEGLVFFQPGGAAPEHGLVERIS